MIFETLYVLFKADSKGLEKDLENVDRKADRTSLALTKTAKAADKTSNSFRNLAASTIGALAGTVGISAIFNKFSEAARMSESIYALSKSFGVSVEQISAFGQALKLQEGTLEEFRMSLITVAREQGITITELFNKLPDMADYFSTLDPSTALATATILGFDEKSAALLLKGREYVLKLTTASKEFTTITTEQAEAIHLLNEAWLRTSGAFDRVENTLLHKLTPSLTDASEELFKFLTVLQENPKAMRAMEYALGALGVALGGATLLWTAMTLVASPWLLLGLAIAAVLGIAAYQIGYHLEDIQKFWSDTTNKILEETKIFGKVLGDVVSDAFAFAAAAVEQDAKKIDTTWRDLLESLQSLNDAFWVSWESSFTKYITEGLAETYRGLTRPLSIEYLTEQQNYNSGRRQYNPFADVSESPLRLSDTLNNARDYLNLATHSPLSSIPNSALSSSYRTYNNSTSVTTGNITVNTQATEGYGTANAIAEIFNNNVRQSMSNMDDGVLN